MEDDLAPRPLETDGDALPALGAPALEVEVEADVVTARADVFREAEVAIERRRSLGARGQASTFRTSSLARAFSGTWSATSSPGRPSVTS